MRPPPFTADPLPDDDNFVRERASQFVWHRVFHRPLYADTDRSQVVYHANYLRYFELGRASLMRAVGYPYNEVEKSGYVYPIIDLAVRFHKPLFYDDPMWVHTRPAERDRVKVLFEYIITNAESGIVLCSGHTRHCALGKSGHPTQIDEMTVRLWQEFPKPL